MKDKLSDLWCRFRGLHLVLQILLWIFLWPLLLGLLIAKSSALGRTSVPIGLAVALLFGVAWVGAISADQPKKNAAKITEATSTPARTKSETTPSPTRKPEREDLTERYPDKLVRSTFVVARELCFYTPRDEMAKDLGYSGELEDTYALAEKYSEGSTAGKHRLASHAGCSEGLNAPRSGEEKQWINR